MPGLLETLEDIQYGHEAHRKLVEEVYLGPLRVCPLFSSLLQLDYVDGQLHQ